jgi:hypothetical protein
MAPIFFESPASLRKWLEKNHARQAELFVGFHKRHTGKNSITWAEAVDQALCFGWIDGVRRTLDDDAWMIRLTPRGARSNWSAVNVKRAGELTELGLMTAARLKVFNYRPASKPYSYERGRREFEGLYLRRLKSNGKAWGVLPGPTAGLPWRRLPLGDVGKERGDPGDSSRPSHRRLRERRPHRRGDLHAKDVGENGIT